MKPNENNALSYKALEERGQNEVRNEPGWKQ